MAWNDDVVAATEQAFEPLHDPERAAAMFAYFKEIAPFLGIGAKPRRAAQREAWRTLGRPTPAELLAAAHELCAEPEREFAWEVDRGIVRRALEQASARALPVMVFVGNAGAIQIHTGPVERIQDVRTWLNVLDPGFNLHLREDHVATAWVVRKPSVDGIVTSIEVFDAAGELIVQFFGKRKPGIPERDDWRALVNDVQAAPAS